MKEFYFVYVLQSEQDGNYYIGSTDHPERRLQEHNASGTSYTQRRGPWQLIYVEGYPSKRQALSRERKLKKSSWHKKELMDRILER